MEREVFNYFRQVAYERAGIDLHEGKQALVEGRLAKRLRTLGLGNEGEYAEMLKKDTSGGELVHFLDAISTNFTSFFREPDHFDELHHLVSDRLAEGQRDFKFWSAACSSGEEIYTMAMTLTETLQGTNASYKILGTDISTNVLGRAKAALYEEAQVGPVPEGKRKKYFLTEKHAGKNVYRVHPSLRSQVSFARLNLSAPPFPMAGPFDTVFCRNVMIYFDVPVRQRLVAEIERLLRPGGLLLVSHTETLTGCRCGLEMIRPSVYRKPA